MSDSNYAVLKPIGVFWDIENCRVPKNKSALCVVQRIRDVLFSGHREAEFMCVCDITKERNDVIQELNSGQVNVVHVAAISKNAADDKLRQSMRRFSDTCPPPATVVLISSDVNFSSDLSDLRHRKNFTIVLIHGPTLHDSLLACAHEHHYFDELTKDIPTRCPVKCTNELLEVRGYPIDRDLNQIRKRLASLSLTFGGHVVSVTPDHAVLKFKSKESAYKAKRRMNGEDTYGCKISVDFAAAIEALPVKPGGNQSSYKKPDHNFIPRTGVYSEGPYRNRPRNHNMYRPTPSVPLGVDYHNDNPDGYHQRQSSSRSPNHFNNVLKSYTKLPPPRDFCMLKQQIFQEDQITNGGIDVHANTVMDHLATPFYPSHPPRYNSNNYNGYQGNRTYNNFQPSGFKTNGFQDNVYPQNSWQNAGFYPYSQRRSPRSSPYYYAPHPTFSPHYCSEPSYGRYSPMYPQDPNGFQPIRYHTSPPRPASAPVMEPSTPSPCYQDSAGPVELAVGNLDYNITAKEWRKILFTTFHPQVKVLNVYVKTQPDNTSIGMIKVPSIEEARFAISQFHRKKIGYKRIHVALKNEDSQQTATNIRAEAMALLMEAKSHVLPLFKFIELFDKRYHRSISVSELYKMKDIIDIHEQGGAGRMVYLLEDTRQTPSPNEQADIEVQEILEVPVCLVHCPEGSTSYVEALNCTMLPNVNIQMKTFAAQVHTLLQSHEGNMPLLSFVACYEAEFSPLEPIEMEGGVPLEHLISCVPGTQIVMSKTGVKKVQWMENKLVNAACESLRSTINSPLLTQQLSQISREIVDLLKHHPQCRMPFSKFIPAYHHHFGRQCRVADYGYTKLYELFDALPHVLQVMGTGDRRILTLSHRAQIRRFTTDLLRVLKAQATKQLNLSELPENWEKVVGKALDVCEYGMCCVEDLLTEIPATTVLANYADTEVNLAIPRRDQTSEEVERTKQFSLEVVDLLKHNPQCRMPFNKFIPAYHHHFGRQCRVADYGFTKLMELFEAIPHVVELEDEGEERFVRLTEPELKKVLSEQVAKLLEIQYNGQLSLENFYRVFTCHFGFTLRLRDFNVSSMKELLAKLKHVVKIDVQDGVEYVVLCRQSRFPKLARQILQLLMNQSSGSLPLVELCSRYKTTFGTDCDVGQIREELLDFVQVTAGDESAVISLTPLQIFARDVRLLLRAHRGRIPLQMFETAFHEHFGVEIKPALYGYPTVIDLLQAIPHVILLRGKGVRRFAILSQDMEDVPPVCGSPPLSFISTPPKRTAKSPILLRQGSKSPSDDSGVMDSHGDEISRVREVKSPSPFDLLSGRVPSVIPSPELHPADGILRKDLMRFESPNEQTELLWRLTEDEKKGQKTPLCQTPTSELLQFAAHCLHTDKSKVQNTETEYPRLSSQKPAPGEYRRKLPSHSTPTGLNRFKPKLSVLDKEVAGLNEAENGDPGVQEMTEVFSTGWWRASPEQLEQITIFQPPTGKKEALEISHEDSLNISAVKSANGTLPFSHYTAADTSTNNTSANNSSTNTVESLHPPKTMETTPASLNGGDSGIRSRDVSDVSFQDDHPVDTSSVKSDYSGSTSLPSFGMTPRGSPRKSPRKPRIAAKFLVPMDNA